MKKAFLLALVAAAIMATAGCMNGEGMQEQSGPLPLLQYEHMRKSARARQDSNKPEIPPSGFWRSTWNRIRLNASWTGTMMWLPKDTHGWPMPKVIVPASIWDRVPSGLP
ncbi:MAG: hypothetical protein C6W55_07965 [Thermobacillus sp.]|uniref:hypothetical protein n=1 Tax=Thermobacillus sp. TaxID=2108467 RepID=UPI000E399E02|nr:hypothetical protein [Thermobacillus sp.]REK56122.1 MAG: hypothetical protein C6W55_07965 [Thermobacillus sp.]